VQLYNLLIVDDERQIREGLKKMIPWNEYDIQICGEAEDGLQALGLIEKLHPQIVFTDIRMPVMDGLQLLQELKKQDKKCKVVVLSGYDDFSLIRKAMKNGAMDYLLKPSGKDEILQILEEMIDNFEDDVNSKLINNENLNLLKTNVMSRLIRNDISLMELKQKFELMEIDFPEGPYAVAVIEIVDIGEGQILSQTFMVCDICQDIIERNKQGIVFVDSIGKVTIILSEIEKENNIMYIKDILNKVMERTLQTMKLCTVISIGGMVNTHRNLKRGYQEATKTLEYQFVFGIDSILFYDEIKEYFGKKNDLPEIDGNEIRKLIQKGDCYEVDTFVKEVFERYVKKEFIVDRFLLRNCALEMIILAFQCLDEVPMIERTRILDMKEKALKNTSSQNNLSFIQKTVSRCFFEIIEETEKSQDNNHSKLVFDMIRRVQEQYSDAELSLQYLAEEFHVNTAYLGRIFKKETNSSFTNYLNKFRIEKAKELLVKTNYKGSKLYKEVGFANYNYFYTVFRKITGKSPMDYRR